MPQIAEIIKPASAAIPAALLGSIDAGLFDDAASRAWLVQYLHGSAVDCPECGREITSERQRASFHAGTRLCCKSCGRWFDQRTGTALAATTLKPRQILLLALLISARLSSREIAERVHLNESTVRDWRERLSLPGLRFASPREQG